MRIIAAIAAVATMSAVPIAASADEFGLDLKRIDPNSHHGQMKIENWIAQRADEMCGPVDMPQPLEFYKLRADCQADFRARAWAAVDRAVARNDRWVTIDEEV